MQNGSRGYNAGTGGAPSARPISAAYSSHPPNGKATREANQYRLRSESSNSSIGGGPKRSDSRAATAMQAGVPSREASHRDRSYSQNQPIPPGSGLLPPRRSSRAVAGGNTDISSPGPSNGSAIHDTDGSLVPSSEEWKDKGAALGVREEYDDNGKLVLRQVKKGVRDFVFGRTLGEGSYSTVLLATDRQTLKEYAVKILDKKHIIKEKKIKYVNIEKDTLNRLIEHPGIVRLYYTFQDSASLYYVLDIASGGELLGVLKKIGSFDEECTRFYGAQILDAIEHMHNRGVIHRDLKPENVLLDDQMHIKITDFGTAKLLPDPRKPKDPATSYDVAGEDDESTRAQSFVGTAEYVSPELLTEKNACKASDLWAFGCIIYQLLTGRPPFKAANEYLTFQKIVGLDYAFPPGFPPAARDLVERLLVLDPQRRLSIEHIKNHEFFDGIQWGRGLWRMKAPRLKPYIPPAQEPNIIRLNDYSGAPLPTNTASRAQPTSNVSNGNSRPQPRIITELPPPTQLDIEWSPVLTRNNERILKLGNLMVLSAPLPHSPSFRHEHGETQEKKKLSRFFGSSTTKKRQRLVMVTSSARIILAAAGGEEKKTKLEISLLAPDCSWRTQIDAKGHMVWCVDTVSNPLIFLVIAILTFTSMVHIILSRI
jgi:3-phosphoinositide dependent protein kinase-1